MKNETFLTKSNQERDRTRRRQQRIAEQYWRNKRNAEKESSELLLLSMCYSSVTLYILRSVAETVCLPALSTP